MGKSIILRLFFCPFWANVGCEQIPKALPWADLLLAFQAVFSPTVNTPLSWGGVECVSVQADMLSACLEYEDILSDKQRGAHPIPPKGREPDTHPQPLPKGGGARDKHLHVQADMLSA